jgi:hypothetical protein
VNEALPFQAVALLYTYGKFGRRHGWERMTGREGMKLGSLIGEGSKFRFAPDLLRPILQRNRSDIAWMEARLGQSLDEELGQAQPGDVREEWDLLRPDPAVVERLLTLLGDAAPRGVKGETPEEVALLVHALRSKPLSLRETVSNKLRRASDVPRSAVPRVPRRALATADGRRKRLGTLLDEVQQSNPAALNGFPRAEAENLVRDVFAHMSGALSAAKDGFVDYEGLGRFRVRQVVKEIDGKKVTRTQIAFLPAQNQTEG